MNIYPDLASNNVDHALQNDPRWAAVQHVLASPHFVRAPRMRAMLAFLMARKLSGREASISEHAIGIEVFHRDVHDFDTTFDPIVRVQMGRLRHRLIQYYAMSGAASDLQIVIPLGTYTPILIAAGSAPPRLRSVALAPVLGFSAESAASAFISGLGEELSVRLFQEFGGESSNASVPYRVEVRVRTEPMHARATIRLIDGGTGQIAWIQPCDRKGELGIAMQEKMAGAICDGLRHFMLGGDASRGILECCVL